MVAMVATHQNCILQGSQADSNQPKFIPYFYVQYQS